MTIDHHHDLARRDLVLGRRTSERDRVPDTVAQRWDPEVLFEFGERLGERLGHGARTVDRAGRDTTHDGGDRS